MAKYNFHSHTKRCGHANGEDEEYVLSAIDNGYKTLGFSDHTPIYGFIQPRIRMNEGQIDDYTRSANSLKEKYKAKIDIHIGLEVEYFPFNMPYVESLLKEGKIEYIILGQHFYKESRESELYLYDENELSLYIDHVIKGIETGLFLYIAHPDHYGLFYHRQDENSYNEAKRLILKAKELGVPLELNISKLANNIRAEKDLFFLAPFPIEQFWKLVGEIGADVVLGLDAHTPLAYYDSPLEWADEFIKKHNLHVISNEEVVDRINKIKNNLSLK